MRTFDIIPILSVTGSYELPWSSLTSKLNRQEVLKGWWGGTLKIVTLSFSC